MKIYNDTNQMILVQTITSADTFISSITGIIKNHILNIFPKDYFKYIYTDTSETFQEHNKADLNNKTLHKIDYPSLSISPQLSIENVVGGLKNILTSSPNFWLPRDLNRQYPTLLEDPDGKYKVYFSSDYITMNLRFKIITDSFIQAAEIGYFLKSRFDDTTFKYLSKQLIQAEVPKSFINAIARLEHIGTDTEDEITNAEDLRKLELMLGQMSKREKPILRKNYYLPSNNRRMGYFFEEKVNLLTLFADLDIPEGVIRDNSVNGEYEINFRVQVSAWWPNAFIMSVDQALKNDIGRVVKLGAISDNVDSRMIYSTSIATPLAVDRKETIAWDVDYEKQIGQNILHEVWALDGSEPIKSINIANLLWGD